MTKDIHIEKKYATQRLIPCELNKLSQVFLNILDNAIQALNGGGTIYIETNELENQYLILIRDTGEGIEAEINMSAIMMLSQNIGRNMNITCNFMRFFVQAQKNMPKFGVIYDFLPIFYPERDRRTRNGRHVVDMAIERSENSQPSKQ